MTAKPRTGWIEPGLLLGLFPILVWSWVDAADRLTWWLEAAPIFIAVPILGWTCRRFPLTLLTLCLIWAHAVILLVGAHYTYAEVPLGDWVSDWMGWQRNHYDRLGHLAQGFIPAIIARELLIRLTPLRPGGWLFAIITLCCLGISALYELVEWLAAVLTGTAADAFLGTQGDVWDTQTDMALALLGAILGQVILRHAHDRQLKTLHGNQRD